MIEKLKQIIKQNFSNGPTKAKVIISAIAILVVVVIAVTIMSMKKTLIISIDGK